MDAPNSTVGANAPELDILGECSLTRHWERMLPTQHNGETQRIHQVCFLFSLSPTQQQVPTTDIVLSKLLLI